MIGFYHYCGKPVVDSGSVEVDESSQVGDESDIQGDSSEDDMKWRLFEDTYKETDSGRAAENYAHNKGIKIEGFVKYGQENPPVCDLMLGETRFAGVGCEVIAAYNYLTYEGFEPDMAKLAYDFEKNALIAADGSLGSNPRKISGLFKAMGVGYKRFYKVDEAQAAVEKGKPVIVSYHIGLNIFSGIHTVFAVKEEGQAVCLQLLQFSGGQDRGGEHLSAYDKKQPFYCGLHGR